MLDHVSDGEARVGPRLSSARRTQHARHPLASATSPTDRKGEIARNLARPRQRRAMGSGNSTKESEIRLPKRGGPRRWSMKRRLSKLLRRIRIPKPTHSERMPRQTAGERASASRTRWSAPPPSDAKARGAEQHANRLHHALRVADRSGTRSQPHLPSPSAPRFKDPAARSPSRVRHARPARSHRAPPCAARPADPPSAQRP